MICPSLTELCAPNAEDALHAHLSDCPRCRAIVRRIDADDEVAVEPGLAPPDRHEGPPPRPGDVWALWGPGDDTYLVAAVLEATSVDLLVVPLLIDVTWAGPEDLRLPPDVLGYPALAAVWTADHMLVEQATEAVDVLSEQCLSVLRASYNAFVAGEPLPSPTGPPVIGDEDPRLAAHAAAADDLRRFYTPWAALQVADELGPVLAERRCHLGVELDDLPVDVEAWRHFEAGKSDPFANVPVRQVAGAVRELGLVASQRVLELARASVHAHHHGDEIAPTPAMARRRRGIAPRPRRDPDAARQAADQYAEALAKELGL